MPRKPVIAVVGTGQDNEHAMSDARTLGRLIAEQGWVLITGGRNAGVMRAANEGARSTGGSLKIGILPDRKTEASSDLDVRIVTDIGEARNNVIVLSADLVIACGVDDPGTASEVALALKAGKPVILVSANREAVEFFVRLGSENIKAVDSPVEAIRLAQDFMPFHEYNC